MIAVPVFAYTGTIDVSAMVGGPATALIDSGSLSIVATADAILLADYAAGEGPYQRKRVRLELTPEDATDLIAKLRQATALILQWEAERRVLKR